jgi:hypothetical protein
MDTRTLVDTMVSVGERYATGTHDLRALAVKLVVLSLRYVDRPALWARLFEADGAPAGEYVDWPLVERVTKGNPLGDVSVWLALLAVCRWECLHAPAC